MQLILPVFVDNMTFVSKSLDAVKQAITDLSKHFKLHDLGPITEILEVKIDRDCAKHSLRISQPQYCIEMLACFNITPIDPGLCLSCDQSPKTT